MSVVLTVLCVILLLVFVNWLGGADLSAFDRGYPAPVAGAPPSAQSADVVKAIEEFSAASTGKRFSREGVQLLRDAMDGLGQSHTSVSEIRPTGEGEPAGEWLLAKNYDGARRLLYVHGGGFIAGSPLSHRAITDSLAQLTGMAVLSLDYRLVPESARLAGLRDTESAIEWLGRNGPDGEAPAEALVIAGDSAGGNLTLATLQSLRDRGQRQVDAAIAICPSTDGALSSPSMRYNLDSDPLLRRAFEQLLSIPEPVRNIIFTVAGRRRPAAKCLSPLRGDLAQLPPTLVQVSLSEVLLDDAARYFHRAREQGSHVELETFDNMVHVWHIFNTELPEAQLAMSRIQAFLERTIGPTRDSQQSEAAA